MNRLFCLAALAAIAACARMGPPPGGPEDKLAPKLLGTVPESLGVYPGWDGSIEFKFDEIVSEGSSPNLGTGTGDLEKLFFLSPTKSVPQVHWRRDRILVKPREGWVPNRVYRVEMLPGVVDLRRNKADTSVVLTFSTGGPIPSDTLRGFAIDWVAGRPAVRGLVELVLLPDSLVYRTLTDSSGRFEIGPLPRGAWTVFGVLDQNHNLRRESRENYDSAEVAEGETRVATLWLIPRDTVGPRITTITPDDSLSATVTFSQPLDPGQDFAALQVSLLRQQDSSPVAFRSLLPKPLDDSLTILRARARDSARAAADTTARPDSTPPKVPTRVPARRAGTDSTPPSAARLAADSIIKSRPRLFDKLVLRMDSAFAPEAKFLLEIRGVRSAAGVAGDARSVLAIPKAKPAAVAPNAQPSDSAAAAPAPAVDTTRVKPHQKPPVKPKAPPPATP